MHAGAEGRLRLKVTPRRGELLDAGDGAPFAITGGGGVIPAGEERAFLVSFAPGGDGPADAVLVARLAHPEAVVVPSGGTSRAHPGEMKHPPTTALDMMLRCELVAN